MIIPEYQRLTRLHSPHLQLRTPTMASIRSSVTARATSVRAAATEDADGASTVAVVAVEMVVAEAAAAAVVVSPREDLAETKSRRALADGPWVDSHPLRLRASPGGACTPWHGGVHLAPYRLGGSESAV